MSARAVSIISLLVLSAIGAELLSGYNDTTGRPLAVLFNLAFFAALYGCPALLIREAARRAGGGWTAIILLSAAAGLLQAGVIDQSLFAGSYGDVRDWEEWVRATYVAPLGISAFLAQSFLLGHVVYSFCAPIALAEAFRPANAGSSWLGRRGIAVATVLWLVVAAMILTGERHASALELAITLAVVAALSVTALRSRTPCAVATVRERRAPRARTVLVVAFLAAGAHSLAPETWAGFALAAAVALGGTILLARSAPTWSLEHVVAAATGVLLARGALAFTYFPVVGETPAGPKYAHNVAMLAIVLAAGGSAASRARRQPTATDAADES